MPKLAAHRPPGRLHLAFSIFVFDASDRLLLQRRADTKHHFRGQWSNTCCSHPHPGEDPVDAGRRRLGEEMGFAVALRGAGSFTYEADDPDSGLVEREVDHVLVGRFNGVPAPDPAEVGAWRWETIRRLRAELREHPENYTPWLAAALAVALQDR
jgi:isopentenyl-diphosphate delta-isomerase